MKKAYILLSVMFLVALVSFWFSLSLTTSSYTPRILSDTQDYLQARILAHNSKELAKYFLYKAKKDGKECLNSITLSYPSHEDKIRIDYFYALAECKNYKLHQINNDANLSKDGVITISVNIALHQNNAVNEEILVHKNLRLLARENFWKP